jgi:hypothetical protein
VPLAVLASPHRPAPEGWHQLTRREARPQRVSLRSQAQPPRQFDRHLGPPTYGRHSSSVRHSHGTLPVDCTDHGSIQFFTSQRLPTTMAAVRLTWTLLPV